MWSCSCHALALEELYLLLKHAWAEEVRVTSPFKATLVFTITTLVWPQGSIKCPEAFAFQKTHTHATCCVSSCKSTQGLFTTTGPTAIPVDLPNPSSVSHHAPKQPLVQHQAPYSLLARQSCTSQGQQHFSYLPKAGPPLRRWETGQRKDRVLTSP